MTEMRFREFERAAERMKRRRRGRKVAKEALAEEG